MQYFLGSFITILTIILVARIFSSRVSREPVTLKVQKNSQSYTYELLSPLMPIIKELSKKKLTTQATKHQDSLYVRVIIVDGLAYWIHENRFMMAEMADDGIVKESSKPVDTMGMDKVQLDKMTFIVDRLTEGLRDDSSNSGNTWI